MEIFKEKKKEDFRIVIFPIGKNHIGLSHIKNYALILYLRENEYSKLGNLILWALDESDNEIFESMGVENYSKKYFNRNSYSRVLRDYNFIDFTFFNEEYVLTIYKKVGRSFASYTTDEEEFEYKFKEKPTPYELGLKVMEMFEYKERYDGLE